MRSTDRGRETKRQINRQTVENDAMKERERVESGERGEGEKERQRRDTEIER